MSESDTDHGVQFPADATGPGTSAPVGRRSTSAFGRAVLARALTGADDVGARAVQAEANWRAGYLTHFRRAVDAGLGSADAAVTVARRGVEAVAFAMHWVDPDSGEDQPLAGLIEERLAAGVGASAGGHLVHEVVGTGERVKELALPHRGRMLTGSDLDAQLTAWVEAGVVEAGVARAVRAVAAHPEWLAVPGHTVVALGAGAEIGPTPTLLRWGARVVGVDLPRPDIWRRVLQQAEEACGTLVVPVRPGDGDPAGRAGVDLLTELPELAAWVDRAAQSGLDDRSGPGPGSGSGLRSGGSGVVLGNYLYADGAANVRVSAAGDALARWLRGHHPDLIQAYLATPTDVFAVPGAAVERSVAAYRDSAGRWPTRGLRVLSAGRLLRRAYLPGADPGICDSLVPQQGPNYALAKRMQRWRATVERAERRRVSLNVAPPTRTRSVVKNRALAAAYAGAHRFGVEVFEASTTRVLMAALLVHDLYADVPSFDHPWRAEAHQAAHGGLWTSPFEPRSALGLAAVLGYGASRQ